MFRIVGPQQKPTQKDDEKGKTKAWMERQMEKKSGKNRAGSKLSPSFYVLTNFGVLDGTNFFKD